MIVGIGIDLVTVSRIRATAERFGERFERRILTDGERAEVDAAPDRGRFLAKRFAVKEAAVKALGTGERAGVLLRHFGLLHGDYGRPLLEVAAGEARRRCDALGVCTTHVSLSDEGDLVIAFVVLEANALPASERNNADR